MKTSLLSLCVLVAFCSSLSASPRALELIRGWKHYGGPFSTVSFTKKGSICVVTGVIRGVAWGPVARLDENHRPTEALAFNLATDTGPARVNVLANGEVVWREGGGKRWLSLTGLAFSTKKGKDLTIAKGFTALGLGFAPPRVVKEGNLCVVTGALQASTWGHCATLPKGHRPPERLVFTVNSGQTPARIDVNPDGTIRVSGGYPRNPWVSLSGLVFATQGHEIVALAPGWDHVGSPFGRALVVRDQGLCVLSGVVKGAHWGHVATVPPSCRPQKRVVCLVNHHHRVARVDVLTDGRVVWKAGRRKPEWLSLSGVVYDL